MADAPAGSIEQAVLKAVATHPELVTATARRVPKAWGRLAAVGITAFRSIVGRAPSDDERRAIWSGLWREVTKGPGPMR